MSNAYLQIDLRTLARELKNKTPYMRFSGLVEGLHSITSARSELLKAIDCLRLLLNQVIANTWLHDEPQNNEQSLIAGSLYCQAVILYAKATQTSGRARRPTGLRDKLPAKFRDIHNDIMDLRNEALAHYSGGGDRWTESEVVVHVSPSSFRVLTPSQSFVYRGDQAQPFLELAETVEEIAREIELTRYTQVSEEFARLAEQDVKFAERSKQVLFDPSAFWRTDFAREAWDRAGKNDFSEGERRWVGSTTPPDKPPQK